MSDSPSSCDDDIHRSTSDTNGGSPRRPELRESRSSRKSTMRDRPILMLVGGGLEHGGGIGRLVSYVTKAWDREIYPPITLIDPRGPDRILLWPFFLIKSIFQIIRRSPQHPLVHIHLAANFSTLRKLILANLSRLLRLRFRHSSSRPALSGFLQFVAALGTILGALDVHQGRAGDRARKAGSSDGEHADWGAARPHRYPSKCRAGAGEARAGDDVRGVNRELESFFLAVSNVGRGSTT